MHLFGFFIEMSIFADFFTLLSTQSELCYPKTRWCCWNPASGAPSLYMKLQLKKTLALKTKSHHTTEYKNVLIVFFDNIPSLDL